ncbi:hypothetical protein F5148DRAFT_901617 [Russula earlei]|uniref:Uncharacterized protein n=2 Tax=Russula earlei TaxID=71964 RepID=A0ACC0UL08_9AGAM|nr:hypothetical protein F5148DRAFT_51952 [Russula earlei]KAI9512419.1 hypothetical protein F5148DRAFT_901617 [Russula earlei]
MSTPVCTTISANPNVVGKVIRINFYITMILLAIIPETPNTKELLDTLNRMGGFACRGLVMIAVIQTATKQLTLFEALFILHIVLFVTLRTSPMGKDRRSKSQIAVAVFILYPPAIAFAAWGLYLWINKKHYELHPECNDRIKYAIMFKTVKVSASGIRDAYIVLFVIIIVGLVIAFGHDAVHLWKRKEERWEEERDPPDVTQAVSVEVGVRDGSWYIDVSGIPLFSAIYATVMMELTVKRNAAHVVNGTNVASGVVVIDESWALGQALSVLMIIASAKEFARYLGFRGPRLALKREARGNEVVHDA